MYELTNNDILNYEYIIVYSDFGKKDKKACSYPKESFEINLNMMIERGCIIHSIHKKLSNKKIHNIINGVMNDA